MKKKANEEYMIENDVRNYVSDILQKDPGISDEDLAEEIYYNFKAKELNIDPETILNMVKRERQTSDIDQMIKPDVIGGEFREEDKGVFEPEKVEDLTNNMSVVANILESMGLYKEASEVDGMVKSINKKMGK